MYKNTVGFNYNIQGYFSDDEPNIQSNFPISVKVSSLTTGRSDGYRHLQQWVNPDEYAWKHRMNPMYINDINKNKSQQNRLDISRGKLFSPKPLFTSIVKQQDIIIAVY